MRRVCWVGFLAAAVSAQETLSDDWNLVCVAGREIGYIHTRVTRRGDVVETVSHTRVAVHRKGTDVVVDHSVTTEEQAESGALLRMHSKLRMSREEVETIVRFEGNEAILSTTVMGQVRETRVDCPSDAVGPYRIERLIREVKQGATLEARTFLAMLNGPATIQVTGGGEEEVALRDGNKERLRRIETTYGDKPVLWLDTRGAQRKAMASIAGTQIETYLVTEECARRASSEAPASEGFMPVLLAPHPIPSPRALDRATYRIRTTAKMPAFADDRQSAEEAGNDTVILRIERKVPPEGHAGRRVIGKTPAELADALAATSMVQSDAREIVAMAREVAGSEPDAWKAAQKLERWVADNVVRKDVAIGFASALEVIREGKGDCTECSALLCALCRASGIPARFAMGVVCTGNEWAGHAWNEVWIDGKWYALDATLGRGSVDAAHITLSRATFKDTGFAEEFPDLLESLGSLEIDATEIVFDGRVVRLGEQEKPTAGR